MEELREKGVYRLKNDFLTWDYDGQDNYGIMYHKGEYIFVCECGQGEGGYYALIASKRVTINWGPAGTREILPLLEEINMDIANKDDLAKILLLLNGNMSIFDNKIRWNK